MKKTFSIAVVLVLVLFGAVFAQDAWEQRFGDFIGGSIPQSTTFASRTEIVDYWRWNGHAGHGGGVESDRESVRVLYFKGQKESGCWIGNATEPHNWAVAPLEVCR